MNEPASRSRGLLRPASLRYTLLGAVVIGSLMLAAGCHAGGPAPQHHAVDGGGKSQQVERHGHPAKGPMP